VNYRELFNEGKKKAIDKEESAVLILLLYFSKMESAQLYASMNEEVNEEIKTKFEEALDLYVNRNVPIQHITGYQTFFGYDFFVNKDVLIPRSETEQLVENILTIYDEYFFNDVKVVDIGCGSGCIGITLALEEKKMDVTLTDISHTAIEVAKKNAKSLNANVKFLEGDMLEPIKNMKFDILVSNPPYIPNGEDVDSLVKDNEPRVALFGGEDGLKFYRIILSQAPKYVKGRSLIAFEHAYDKGDEMTKLAKKYFPQAEVRLIKDLNNKDRITIIINKVLYDGEVVIFPTDTVYGLGTKVNDIIGQERIMALKKRIPTKRFAVLCANLDQIKELAFVDEKQEKIINAFMPGALTVILRAKTKDKNYAINETIAVRIPNHELTRKLLLETGPLATTSVNITNEKPLNDYQEIKKLFYGKVDYIYNDPSKQNYTNVASTIVDLTNQIEMIREGDIKLKDILQLLE